ncbi:MAG: hypothetical protein AB1449_03020 [Chloroflexota bacterium]
MHPPDTALDLAQAMVEDLEDFLLSDEILWPITQPRRGRAVLPRLTVGGLLLAMDELAAHASGFSPAQAARAERVRMQLEALRARWTAAFARKAAREIRMRAGLWRAYLEDLEETGRGTDDYPQEVHHRVMIDRLLETAAHEPEAEALRPGTDLLDARLRSLFRPGEFVWDARLRPIYPERRFWYLYGAPRPPSPP